MNTTRTVVCFCLFLLSFSILGDTPSTPFKAWQIEIGAGGFLFGATDLARFQEAENQYLNLYFHNNPTYSTQEMATFSSLKHLLSGQIRLRYRLNPRLALEIGFRALEGSHQPSDRAEFTSNEGWRTLTDTLTYTPLGTSLRLLFPHLGASATYTLGPRTDIGVGLHGGPVFAHADLNRTIQDEIAVRESQTANEYIMYRGSRIMTMTGTGTGVGAGVALTLRYKLGPKWGLFLETGGDFFSISRIRGSGSSMAGGQVRNWEEDWFMVGESVTKSWGTADFLYPSSDPSLHSRKTADFHLSILAYCSLQVGLTLTL